MFNSHDMEYVRESAQQNCVSKVTEAIAKCKQS